MKELFRREGKGRLASYFAPGRVEEETDLHKSAYFTNRPGAKKLARQKVKAVLNTQEAATTLVFSSV